MDGFQDFGKYEYDSGSILLYKEVLEEKCFAV